MATTRKTRARQTAPKPKTEAPPADAPAPVTLRKRDLISEVVAETGVKRRDVKAVTEAVLAVMGRAVGEGQNLALEPLGRLRVARTAETGAKRVLTCKLRQKATPVAGE